MLYPLRFKPLYFEKIWGGRRLETVLGRHLPSDEPIGESWEVSDHPHGRSIVVNGSERGRMLHELVLAHPVELLGARVMQKSDGRFPLLVKYIDADDKLSVQVHPDDAYAAAHEGELGKTEMWYVLYAESGAQLIAGLNAGVTKEQFQEALEHGDPASLLHHIPVSAGDAIFIPAGRIHAIMPGLVILEIQENSDTTYRLYDWGRVGLDGKPRELHVQQAMEVADWTDYDPVPGIVRTEQEGPNTKTLLAECSHFVVEKYDLHAERDFVTDGGSFSILNCINGNATLKWDGGCEHLVYADSLLIPAEITHFTLHPQKHATIIRSYVP